jgi:4-hydroxy-L-threonine phosphate dehydrogenase PdxA
MKSHLAITMGDPAGIGPEIIVKACSALSAQLTNGVLKLLIIGHATALEQARAAFAPELKIPTVSADGFSGDRTGRALGAGRPCGSAGNCTAQQGSAE